MNAMRFDITTIKPALTSVCREAAHAVGFAAAALGRVNTRIASAS
jgi:hypothetical protein